METSGKSRVSSIATHRRWEDAASMVLGGLAIASAVFAAPPHAAAAALSGGITGALLVAIAGLKLVILRRWEERLEIVCGLWLIVSPTVLVYGGPLGVMHMLLGVTVFALGLFELWQDRDRPAEVTDED